MRCRFAIALAVLLAASASFAQEPAQRELDAERRALEAERRAVDAERRAVDAERCAQASSTGASGENRKREACQAATVSYQTNCSRPGVDPLWETAQCIEARKLMREQCG